VIDSIEQVEDFEQGFDRAAITHQQEHRAGKNVEGTPDPTVTMSATRTPRSATNEPLSTNW
jgi:hypothetical protein